MFSKITRIFIAFTFLSSLICPVPQAQAQPLLGLPEPGTMVSLSPVYNPPALKGIKVYPDNPLRFDFILDQGDSHMPEGQLKDESNKLIRYFLTSLTVPEKDLWVNLSPYEKDRIVPNNFGQTEMGRDLLAQDYLLKQLTASLIYPEGPTGRDFWNKVYAQAQAKFGTTDVSVNTFNKVWIVPEKSTIYENAASGTAYVVSSRLKVMLEQDYLSLSNHTALNNAKTVQGTSALGSKIIREVVIPQLTRDVNEGKNFAQLRQVYNSMILAAWYKKKIKDSILGVVYEDKNRITGIQINDAKDRQGIYGRYLEAFKKGVYNYIKEEQDPVTQQMTPRKYFSGGVDLDMDKAQSAINVTNKLRLQDFGKIGSTFILAVGLTWAGMFNASSAQAAAVTGVSPARVTADEDILMAEMKAGNYHDQGVRIAVSMMENALGRLIKYEITTEKFASITIIPLEFMLEAAASGEQNRKNLVSMIQAKIDRSKNPAQTQFWNDVKRKIGGIEIEYHNSSTLHVFRRGSFDPAMRATLRKKLLSLAIAVLSVAAYGSPALAVPGIIASGLVAQAITPFLIAEAHKNFVRILEEEGGGEEIFGLHSYAYEIMVVTNPGYAESEMDWFANQLAKSRHKEDWVRAIVQLFNTPWPGGKQYVGKNMNPHLVDTGNPRSSAVKSDPNIATWVASLEAPQQPVSRFVPAPGSLTRGFNRAMIATRDGGIDLNSNNMDMQLQNSGEEIKFKFDPAVFRQLQNVAGFTPVIITFKPVVNLAQFLTGR